MDKFITEDNRIIECTDKEIENAIIPDGIIEISEDAFRECKKLTAITFPPTLEKIGECAFRDCISLEEINLVNVSIICAYAFSGCLTLTNVNFGEKLEYVPNSSFSDCFMLSEIKLPPTVSYVGQSAFQNCYSVNKLEAEGLMEIDRAAFLGCSELYSLDLPSSLLHISPIAFAYCSNLKSVTVRSRFIDIDETAFVNANNNMFIKAAPDSAAYRFAVQNNFTFVPAIIEKCYRKIQNTDIEKLKKVGLMFQSKPYRKNEKEAVSDTESVICFDSSQESLINEVLKENQEKKEE